MSIKKIISVSIAAAIFLSSTVFAHDDTEPDSTSTETEAAELLATAFDSGDGTEKNPYIISTETQLMFVMDIPNKCYKLANDIALTSEWIPIGTYGDAFSGMFDGDGHTISNMIISDGDGFFKEVTGTVKNLNITGSVASTSGYAGGIAGKSSGTFENCTFSGTVTGTGRVGGLIGYNKGTSVISCHTSGSVTESEYGYTGGLIGCNDNSLNNDIVTNCYSSCDVKGGHNVGGLIGNQKYATISKCYATGNVQCSNNTGSAGGLVGYAYKTSIKSCFATGDVSTRVDSIYYDAASQGGGLIGYLYDGTISASYAEGNVVTYKDDMGKYKFYHSGGLVGYLSCSSDGTIENCYATGDVTANGFASGLIGLNNYHMLITNCYSIGKPDASKVYGIVYNTSTTYGRVKNSYYDTQTSTCTDTGCGSPKTTSGMKNQLIYDGWDFDDIWAIDPSEAINDGYPYLQWAFDSSVKVTGISFEKTSEDVVMGNILTLAPTLEGENTEKAVLKWTSSNDAVASVSDGLVTAKAFGTAVITASYGNISASCTINVTDGTIKVTSVTLDKSELMLGLGDTYTLTASVLPDDATNKNINWSSNNTAVATVTENGIVTGIGDGTAEIKAVSESNTSCYAVCKVEVSSKRVPVMGIELDKNVFGDAFEVDIGKNLVFSPTIKPSNATNQNVLWTSSDNSVAAVNDGIVTGVSEGTVSITATTADGGFNASVTVKVKKPTVYVKGIVTNTDQLTVNVRESKQLQASVVPIDATDKTITFESNNNAIATVSDTGLVTGVSQGTTLIKAISNTSAGKFVAFCTVTVPKPVVDATSIKLDKGSISIVEGKTVPLKAVIKPVNATYKTVTWSVGDESVATVTQDGYITAVGVGETVVSATTVNNKTTSCTVTVLPSDTPAQLTVEDAQVKAGKDIPITVSIASNPGISTFTFDLTYNHEKLYPVSYKNGDVLKNVTVITPLGSQSFESKDSVRFLCRTNDSKNMDTDGELITVVFRTKADIELGTETIGIVPSGFINENGDAINLQQDDCSLEITDYTIGDINNDDSVDLKDSMILAQYIAGFDVELSEQGKKAAVSIYPDGETDTPEPSLNDFQHLFRYLSDWQVELGKK